MAFAPLDLRDFKKDIHPENIEYCLECGECHASGPLALSQEAAVEAWNRRFQIDALRAEIKALTIARRGFQIMGRNMVANGFGWRMSLEEGQYERAAGDAVCAECRQPFFEHPQLPGFPTFHLTCSGKIVKT